MTAPTNSILTLTSDFGLRDSYVASMTGVILSIAPEIRVVHISHGIAPQDVMEAAHVLSSAARYYPDGTVHLVIVDPEVGTNRRGIALEYENQIYVGPDNGLFSLLIEGKSPQNMVELNRPEYWWTKNPSITFHGRDIFASVAAHLALGVPLLEVGTPLSEIKAMHWVLPISDEQGIQGWVVHVDGFGNCITNIERTQFEDLQQSRAFKCYVGNAILDLKLETYADTDPGDSLVLFNSNNYLEVAINRGSAATMLDIKKGASVNIVFTDEK